METIKDVFVAVYQIKSLEKNEINILFLCLKSLKIILPKPLRLKIYNDSETNIIVSGKYINFFENGKITNKLDHNIIYVKKSTLFDPSKKQFAFLNEEFDDMNSYLQVKRIFYFIILSF